MTKRTKKQRAAKARRNEYRRLHALRCMADPRLHDRVLTDAKQGAREVLKYHQHRLPEDIQKHIKEIEAERAKFESEAN